MPCEPIPPPLTECLYWYEELAIMKFLSLEVWLWLLIIVFGLGLVIFFYKRFNRKS